MEVQDEKLKRLLLQVGVGEKKAVQVIESGSRVSLDRDQLHRLLGAAGTPMMPRVMADPMSPLTGEAGEHNRIYYYIPGCYDIGSIEIKGFTLIANNDLAALKQMALGTKGA